MTPYRAAAEDDLGAPLAEFQRARRTIAADVVLGSVLSTLGVVVLAVVIVQSSGFSLVLAAAISLLFVGVGVFIARRGLLDGDLLLRFCARGLVHRHRGRTVSVPYERVRHILVEPMVERTMNLGTTWWTDHYQLVLDDEQTVELRCCFLENERVQALLDERLAHLTREAEDALSRGESVGFRAITLRPHGVETEHGFFEYAQVSSLELVFDRESEDSSADLRLRTKAGATLLFPIRHLRDVHALIGATRARMTP